MNDIYIYIYCIYIYIHIYYIIIFLYYIYNMYIHIYIYICWFHQHQREFLVTIPLQAMVRYLQQRRFFQMRTGCESCWAFNNHSMDWLNGKLTGKPYFIGETIWFPVSIFLSTSPVNHTMFKTGLAGKFPVHEMEVQFANSSNWRMFQFATFHYWMVHPWIGI